MSGFVALIHGDGRPADSRLFDQMVAAMEYRGPDGSYTSIVADAALGATELRAAAGSPANPLHVSGDWRVAGDARIDDRERLSAELAAAGAPVGADASDTELIAAACSAWDQDAPSHLLGDFAFVAWNPARCRLLAARDHMGVKPLYYAPVGDCLLVGNTLPSLRRHPGVSDALDEAAIADFLVFGVNRHAERTSFADIRRLPPAHSLCWEPGTEIRTRRYWRLEARDQLELADDEYVERLGALLDVAVRDRLRGHDVAILMSGGLDSTSVAAIASRAAHSEGFEVAAVTFGYEKLFEDPEPEVAATAAAYLRIPLHRVALDDDVDDNPWGDAAAWSAEPSELPASSATVSRVARLLPGTRVALTGQGGDPLLHVAPADAMHRARGDGLISTARAALRYQRRYGHLPRAGWRTHWKRKFSSQPRSERAPLPPWIRADLADRLGLAERYRSQGDRELDDTTLRPTAMSELDGPGWSFLLEWYDAGMTGFAAEYRHPFFDLRLVEFLVRVPVIPWLVEKDILRRAMAGLLPDAVLRRRKSALAGAPATAAVRHVPRAFDLAANTESLAQFVDIERFSRIAAHPEKLHPWELELFMRPLGLAHWIGQLESVPAVVAKE